MASVTLSPSSAATIGSTGKAWSSPTNILASDDVRSVQLSVSTVAADNDYLEAYFDFSAGIASIDTIDGFEMTTEGSLSGSGGVPVYETVQLISSSGVGIGDNVADGSNHGGSDTTKTWGGPTDDLNFGGDADTVRAPTFGLRLRFVAITSPRNMRIDHVTMKVYFTAGVGGGGVQRAAAAGCCGSRGDIAGGC